MGMALYPGTIHGKALRSHFSLIPKHDVMRSVCTFLNIPWMWDEHHPKIGMNWDQNRWIQAQP